MKLNLICIFVVTAIVNQSSFGAELDCEVTAKLPAHANFFAKVPGVVFPRTPVVGDKTTFDLVADEVTDISFESGSGLPIKAASAVLTKEHEEPGYLTFYRGTKAGLTGSADYEGRLLLYNNSAIFQLIRTVKFGQVTIHSLAMKCVPR